MVGLPSLQLLSNSINYIFTYIYTYFMYVYPNINTHTHTSTHTLIVHIYHFFARDVDAVVLESLPCMCKALSLISALPVGKGFFLLPCFSALRAQELWLLLSGIQEAQMERDFE